MSERDSGVDTANSDSRESAISMSVGSPAQLDHSFQETEDDSDLPGPAEVLQNQLPSVAADQASGLDLTLKDASSCKRISVESPFYVEHSHKITRSLEHDYIPKIKSRVSRRSHSHDFNSSTGLSYKLNLQPDFYMTMHEAVNSNNIDLVQQLLDQGLDPSRPDWKRRTALHHASSKGYTSIAQRLIDYGANPNQCDIAGNTPLHLAACTSNIEMVTLLLKAGTDVNALDNSGRTPLNLAVSKLKILQSNKEYSSSQLKAEVMKVVDMMYVYLERSGKPGQAGILNAYSNLLRQHQTKEEVDSDVNGLLSSLTHLSLQ